MSTSKYIARLMGPLLLVLGLGMAFGLAATPHVYLAMMKEFTATPGFVFMAGMLALVAGLAIVNAHNLWVADWRVIITVLGWVAVIRGIVSLLFPLRLRSVAEHMVASPTGPVIGAVIIVVLGAILAWMGYEDLWRQESEPEIAAKPARARAPRKTAAAPKAAARARKTTKRAARARKTAKGPARKRR
jgi:uncharacterized protein YacL